MVSTYTYSCKNLYSATLNDYSLSKSLDKDCCSFPLPFHLCQELTAERAEVCVTAVLLRVFPWGEKGRKGSQHNFLFLPALLSSHRKLKGKR